MEELELYFRLKETECDINEIEVQILRLQLEMEKRQFEYGELKEIYIGNVKEQLSTQEEKEIETIKVEKPKKLKKPNDKLSENNIEV